MSGITDDIKKLDDASLANELKKHGYTPGPIVDSTRDLYRKKLMEFQTSKKSGGKKASKTTKKAEPKKPTKVESDEEDSTRNLTNRKSMRLQENNKSDVKKTSKISETSITSRKINTNKSTRKSVIDEDNISNFSYISSQEKIDQKNTFDPYEHALKSKNQWKLIDDELPNQYEERKKRPITTLCFQTTQVEPASRTYRKTPARESFGSGDSDVFNEEPQYESAYLQNLSRRFSKRYSVPSPSLLTPITTPTKSQNMTATIKQKLLSIISVYSWKIIFIAMFLFFIVILIAIFFFRTEKWTEDSAYKALELELRKAKELE